MKRQYVLLHISISYKGVMFVVLKQLKNIEIFKNTESCFNKKYEPQADTGKRIQDVMELYLLSFVSHSPSFCGGKRVRESRA